MARKERRGLGRWFADFAIGEGLSRLLSLIAVNWLPLIGGGVLSYLSTTLPGITGFGPIAFAVLASFIFAGALIALWRNQAVQRRLSASPADKIHGLRFVFVRSPQAPDRHVGVFEFRNQALFSIEVELETMVCTVDGDYGKQIARVVKEAAIAPQIVSHVYTNAYQLPTDGRTLNGTLRIRLKYGRGAKLDQVFDYHGDFTIIADGTDVIAPAMRQKPRLQVEEAAGLGM